MKDIGVRLEQWRIVDVCDDDLSSELAQGIRYSWILILILFLSVGARD